MNGLNNDLYVICVPVKALINDQYKFQHYILSSICIIVIQYSLNLYLLYFCSATYANELQHPSTPEGFPSTAQNSS